MKQPFKRTIAGVAATALMLTSFASASEALGSELRDQMTTVGQGVTVTKQSLWSATYSDLRTEHYIDYIPGGNVTVAVAYGNYLRSRATLSSMAAELETEGKRVVAGINAGFFNTSNGTPIGLVISDGILRTAMPNYLAIGFRADGSAILGEPTVNITASWTEYSEVWEYLDRSIVLSGYNKMRGENGYFLFSDEFSTTTLNSTEGIDVVLRPLEEYDLWSGEFAAPSGMPVSGTISFEVLEVRSSLTDRTIPEGCYVLSVAETAPESQRAILSGLQPGIQITMESSIDEDWTEVVQAASGLYKLVENGEVCSDLPSGANPYTAVGMREDGSVVFYTIDGRQNGYSIGATYRQVAKRMIELGCVTVAALDGGGSTTIGVTYPDVGQFQTINRPSEGKERAVSTALFLVTDVGPSEVLGDFHIVPEQDVVLAGSTVGFQVTSVDTNGYPMHWNGNLKVTSDTGFIHFQDGMLRYTAPSTAGYDAIRVISDEVSGQAKMLVVDTLSSLTVEDTKAGKAVTELVLQPGEVVDLSAVGRYYNLPVFAADTDFVWTMDNAVASVNEQGIVTAGSCNGSGVLTVSGGGKTVMVPVTVVGGDAFSDTSGHWAASYIARLAELGITKGISNGDGTYSFAPNGKINRGELLTMVVRMLNVDTAEFKNVELPFADAAEIQSWMLPYVKAAYGLGLLQGKMVNGMLYAGVKDRVSRETAMVILGRTLEYQLEADLSGFEDGGKVSGWASDHVQTLVALGIVGGNGSKLNPSGSILRGEVAKIITMILDIPPVAEEPAPEEEPSAEEVEEPLQPEEDTLDGDAPPPLTEDTLENKETEEGLIEPERPPETE